MYSSTVASFLSQTVHIGDSLGRQLQPPGLAPREKPAHHAAREAGRNVARGQGVAGKVRRLAKLVAS